MAPALPPPLRATPLHSPPFLSAGFVLTFLGHRWTSLGSIYNTNPNPALLSPSGSGFRLPTSV
ncbi:hypothetical protein CALVIDRAFT_534585 [Calocera viscosa TUFC12733]|uniref:Uncharacterized protein n=1 Tax=Calocera viscosa (strain TUFC12733) TaxID=1330018 RepID=A0A167PRA7_CALVF|nr:hypothetical protein CALVIDRAFT_534585 [Calocera viscosa TUFC12733]